MFESVLVIFYRMLLVQHHTNVLTSDLLRSFFFLKPNFKYCCLIFTNKYSYVRFTNSYKYRYDNVMGDTLFISCNRNCSDGGCRTVVADKADEQTDDTSTEQAIEG